MGRIIENYAAYDVSADMVARDIAMEQYEVQLQAEKDRRQKAWMDEQMDIIRAEIEGRPIPKPSRESEWMTMQCESCGRTLQISKFPKQAGLSGGRSHICEQCIDVEMRTTILLNKVKREKIDRKEDSKVCTMCGERLPYEMFNRNAKMHDGRQSRCKRCIYALRAEKKKDAYRNARYGLPEIETE